MAMTLTGSPQITAAALDAAINAELAANWFPLAGVATVSNASAGQIGEILEATVLIGAAVSLTSTVTATIASIALTAGEWDVWGLLNYQTNAATTVNYVIATLGVGTAALGTRPNGGAWNTVVPSGVAGAAASLDMPTGTRRVNVSGATTINLLANSLFAVNVASAYGYIGARRRR
jgi:hypothetical protein